MAYFRSELASAKENIIVLSNEKESLAQQLSSLSSEVSKKELTQHEAIISLEKKLETKISEYQNIISSMSAQNESMIKSYKVINFLFFFYE